MFNVTVTVYVYHIYPKIIILALVCIATFTLRYYWLDFIENTNIFFSIDEMKPCIVLLSMQFGKFLLYALFEVNYIKS